ncbi:hypothetical protein [Terracoccus sp. 273MFTsu3.1]|uniref:hypothetical protein n=1 Tax=Terracoccus sp. 273MFTsu3.1 TaxID=1172188 RepID=UPI00036D7397|nr:hypothetical protein [Terracoccus sp. 273MFTsu3.1]
MATKSDIVSDTDHLTGWTVQQGGVPAAPESVPGNVIKAEELPLASSLEKQGVDPKQYFANLHIVAGEDEKAVARGEKPGEVEEVSAEDAVAEQEKDADEADEKDEAPAKAPRKSGKAA